MSPLVNGIWLALFGPFYFVPRVCRALAWEKTQ